MKRILALVLLLGMLLTLCACAPKTYVPSGEATGNEALDAQVLAVLESVCKPNASQEENLAAVFDWIVAEISYRAEIVDTTNGFTEELTEQLALDLLNSRRGACDSEAALTAVLLSRMGCQSLIVQGQFLRDDGSELVDHAWVIAKVNDQYFHFDTLYGRFYTENNARAYFMANDAHMQTTHTWQAEEYPTCP